MDVDVNLWPAIYLGLIIIIFISTVSFVVLKIIA